MIARIIAPEGMPRPMGEEGHVLLDEIWAYFSEHHRWPTFADIDRKLFLGGLKFEEAVRQLCPALLLGVDSDLRQLPQNSYELAMTVAGAANCKDTGPAIRVFLGMVRTAADLEPVWLPADRDELPWMRPGDIEHLPGVDPALLTKEVMFAAAALGQRETCFRGGSINREGLDWSLSFDRGIREFADVQRVHDYWRIREKVLGPERTEADNRPFGKQPTAHTLPVPVATPPAQVASVGGAPDPMSVTCTLHSLIAKASAELFNSGFYREAVSRAFQAVEHRVQELADSTETGLKLMGNAFTAKQGSPKLTVTRSTGGSLESEQEGMQFLFKGATAALRNPRMHGPAEADDRDEAEEMLVFASFLMRRLDIEDDKREAAEANAESTP